MSSFDETIEKLKSEIAGHISTLKANEAWSQVEKIYRALGTIEELEGSPKTTLADLFGFSDSDAVSVKPGEFIGEEAVAAAKLYLEKKKAVAASLDEIIEAVQKGGAQPASRDDLRISLARSTWDVVKAPGQELYVLEKYAPRKARKKKAGAAAADDESEGKEKQEQAKAASSE